MIFILALTSFTFTYLLMILIYSASIKSLSSLQAIINDELINVNSWLCANKLSLNVEKSSFVVFHPPQRKIIPSFVLRKKWQSFKERFLHKIPCCSY